MKAHKMILLGATALTLGMLGVSPASAASEYSSEYVKNVDLELPGYAAVIKIQNASSDKHISKINPQVVTNTLDFTIDGFVECKGGTEFRGAFAYFGPVAMGGLDNFKTDAVLHSADIDVAHKVGKNGIAEATEDTFKVPYNKIKQGHPAMRIDALEELNKKLQTHIQGGGSAVDFYKQDHDIVLKRPLSLAGTCGKNAENMVGYEIKDATIQIKYEGDQQVHDNPKLNVELGNNMPNQINNDLPITITNGSFQPNMPHHIGKCIPEDNPKIRVNFNLTGNGVGKLDLRIVPVSNTYADYGPYKVFNALSVNTTHSKHVDFYFPLKQMLSQDKYSYMAISNNKTWNHNMKLEGRIKPEGSDTYTSWKELDTAVFKHRCVPQANVPMGGGVKKFDNQNGNGSDDMPKLQFKQGSVDPKPGRDVKAPQEPKPGLLLPAVQK